MAENKKILVIDDDPAILEVVSIILKENGYSVLTPDGRDLVGKIKKNQPDVIFLDLLMPGVSAEELTKKLKSDIKTKNIPVLILSALNDIDQRAKKIGADGFLPKPFGIEDLLKTIERHIRQ